MKIEASWAKPVEMELDSTQALIYTLDIATLPDVPGVYVFGRLYDGLVEPIYIGQTLSIQKRIKTHLKSVPLMKKLEKAKLGSRVLVYCIVKAGNEDKARKHVKVIERALILHAQSEGFELFNQKGAKLPTDEISFTGNRTSESIAPRKMLIKRALSRSKK